MPTWECKYSNSLYVYIMIYCIYYDLFIIIIYGVRIRLHTDAHYTMLVRADIWNAVTVVVLEVLAKVN